MHDDNPTAGAFSMNQIRDSLFYRGEAEWLRESVKIELSARYACHPCRASEAMPVCCNSYPVLRRVLTVFLCVSLFGLWAQAVRGQQFPAETRAFLKEHCWDCHDAQSKKGELDLETLTEEISDASVFETWAKIHDRVQRGEMPPADYQVVDDSARKEFLEPVSQRLIALDDAQAAVEGRATRRRMNRYEYENTLRDLFDAPWLQVKQMLPEDGLAHRFNKVGDALDVSHVQIARYLAAAEYAAREVMARSTERPPTTIERIYARDCRGFTGKFKYSVFNRSPERATFPLVGYEADVDVLEEKAPVTVGESDPERRELEAVGVVASSYEPIEPKFNNFKAPRSGRYKLRFNAYSFWAGPESPEKWWRPSRTDLSKGRTREPVSVYSETPPRQLRKLGEFEVTPEPSVQELEVYLLAGETIRPDAVRLFRSRPPGPWRNPLAEKDGQPGVAFRWLEVEGPLIDQWPSEGHQLLFGDLPRKSVAGQVTIHSADPEADAERLMRRFLERAYRHPIVDEDVQRFLRVVKGALQSGSSFEEAMIAGYSAVLCSPGFVCLTEKPGRLDDFALASRLSYFLCNSEPDAELRELAAADQLHKPEVLGAQTERLLSDDRSRRFVEAFLDYWLDLRKADATSPDEMLYPDYYLDDYLVESAVEETRAFFGEMLKENLPVRSLIDSDFVMVNQRLAEHYGIAGVEGIEIRKVPLPADCVRGGVLTHASILKITANGTTTSPVTRGVWINERILGNKVPPPPASVPAVEPDIRGATTIRDQLEKHRNVESCNGCHAQIDPPGFALESFDVLGGWRDAYRAVSGEPVPNWQKQEPKGFGKNGQPFTFKDGQPVDPTGELMDGRKFEDIRGLRELILQDERQVARNLVNQLVVYATGAPVRFGDRPEVEAILDAAQQNEYGVRTLIHQLVQSELFLNK